MRVSLTKTQSQTEAAIELIALCQTITSDGSLSHDEVHALREWLELNRGSELPSISFLNSTVEKIVADSKVTDEERKLLHEAVETVLPVDLRRSVRAKRLEAQRLARAEAKLEKQLLREKERLEAERNAPIESFDFMVAGAHVGGRRVYIDAHARVGDAIHVAREPTNRHSRNAIQVVLQTGHQIGYVPEEDARDLAPLLNAGKPYAAQIKKILTGGRSPRPVVVLDVFEKNANVPGLSYSGVRKGDEGLSFLAKFILTGLVLYLLYVVFF